MTDSISSIPNGFRYYFESDPSLRRFVEETAMNVFDGWSYEEIVTPAIDYYSLFESGMGSLEADRAFRFTDTDGRLLALRPDVTTGVARAAATFFAKRPRPLRLCYAQKVFCQQAESHADWRRETTQIGGELIGRNSTAADMEVLAVASEVLQRLGLNRKYVITLNDVEIFNGIAESLAVDRAGRDELRRLVDLRDTVELKRFLSRHPYGESCDFSHIIELSGKRDALGRARDLISSSRSQAALQRLDSLWSLIESLGMTNNFGIDLGDVSRLDYYTGLTFKIYMEGAGLPVGSGGRYDNLIARFGKTEPAVGFVLKLDSLAELKSRDPESIRIANDQGAVPLYPEDTVDTFKDAVERRAREQRVRIEASEGAICRN